MHPRIHPRLTNPGTYLLTRCCPSTNTIPRSHRPSFSRRGKAAQASVFPALHPIAHRARICRRIHWRVPTLSLSRVIHLSLGAYSPACSTDLSPAPPAAMQFQPSALRVRAPREMRSPVHSVVLFISQRFGFEIMKWWWWQKTGTE